MKNLSKNTIEVGFETGPRYVLEVGILKDVVTLTVDTSGVGLHKRSYRQLASQAPSRKPSIGPGRFKLLEYKPPAY